MFRRKEEFDFESEGGEEGAAAMQAASSDSSDEESVSRANASVASAPRPASLSQAPGAAPRMPASAPAPSAFRAATPAPAPSSSAMSAPTASAPVAPSAARPAAPSAPASVASPSGYAASGSSTTSTSKTGGKRILTVGNDILLKGEIATCDRLVIEGEVDAKLNDVHTVEIAETGSFRGKAEIEDAEISGLFEGDLVVRNRLTIYATGKVRGNIAFGEIEIERGGELTGTISMVGQTPGKSKEKAA